MPLSSYLPQSYWNQFAPGLVQGATYQGKVYGSPLFEDQGFLYYRKDLLAKEHLPVPTTWEQLESEAMTLQKAGLVKYGFVWQGGSYEGLDVQLHGVPDRRGRHGDQQQLHQGQPGFGGGGEGGHVHALADHQRGQPGRGDHVPGAAGDVRLRLRAGRVPAELGLRLRRLAGPGLPTVGKVGVAPLPTFAGQSYPGYSTIGGWNLYINPHSTEHRR